LPHPVRQLTELQYTSIKVAASEVKSDHRAVIAHTAEPLRTLNKRRERHVFRKRSPTQHAMFLQHASQLQIEVPDDAEVQSNFDTIYAVMKYLPGTRDYSYHIKPTLCHASSQSHVEAVKSSNACWVRRRGQRLGASDPNCHH